MQIKQISCKIFSDHSCKIKNFVNENLWASKEAASFYDLIMDRLIEERHVVNGKRSLLVLLSLRKIY